MKKNAFYLLITLLLLSFVGISNCSDRKKTGVLSGIVPLALLGTGKTSLPPINKTYPTEETIVLNIGQQLNLSPSQHVEGSEYTISPQLPDGLNLDPKTGVISGTSTASFPATVFTITQTKSDGTKTSWKVTIGVNGNGSNISTAESATPTFNLPAGYYNEPKYISITTSLSGAAVRCTFDGTEPSSSSEEFTQPLHIWSIAGKTLKCKAFKNGTSFGETVSAIYSYPPLKTGQTAVYVTGDDGTNQSGIVRSYSGPTQNKTFTSDYTTTDNATGLIWKTCSQGLSGANCAAGSATVMNWADAVTGPNGCSHLNAVNGGSGYAGIKDWRLPSKQELGTLVDYSKTTGPTVDSDAYIGTVAGYYWTSTSFAPDPDVTNAAWYVEFGDGMIQVGSKDNNWNVRCVSGIPKNYSSNYTDNGDGTVKDNETGLFWQKCILGQDNDSDCSGTPLTSDLGFGINYCNGLNLAGKKWRMPNVNELQSIVDTTYSSVSGSAIDASVFPNRASGYFWSSTSYAVRTNGWNEWVIAIGNGFSFGTVDSNSAYIRCVSGP